MESRIPKPQGAKKPAGAFFEFQSNDCSEKLNSNQQQLKKPLTGKIYRTTSLDMCFKLDSSRNQQQSVCVISIRNSEDNIWTRKIT